jgi:signal transduction histidine kinase
MAVSAAAPVPAQTPAARLRQIGADALYLLLGLFSSVLAFTVCVTGMTLSLTLGLLIVGFPVVVLTFACCRWLADLERRRAALVFGLPIAADYQRGPDDRRLAARLRAAAHDPQRWKDIAYLFLLGELGFACGVIWLVLWCVALGSLTLPAWWWAIPGGAGGTQYLWFTIDTFQESVGAAAIGVALLPVAVLAQRPLALAQAHLARWLLGPSLAARVERLTETRAGAVDAAATELQRIERDLHDGAQARLVALAMDLGMAEERFDRDPESARELVGEAREEAKRALAELRDLARGIRPSLLTERGLGPAVIALAARSPVPATARIDVPRKPPAPVENAAWFVVSEALANAGKHSGAQRATVWLTLRDGHLRVEVVDDGCGGADPAGAGLKGLAQRVAALDGTLEVNSPAGGPTVVRALLPCGW